MSKLFGVDASYTHNRKTAGPGYISSTQYGIVTGTHAVEVIGDQDLYRTGRAVYLHDFVPQDGVGSVSVLTDPTKVPFGVLAKSHVYTPEGLFHDGDVANIITFGCVYMVCSSDMEFEKIHYGKQVAIVRTWGSVVNADNEKISPLNIIKTRWYFTGAVEFDAFDARFGRVKVAEVMVVPGGVVTQGGGSFTPKYGSHRKVGDSAWGGDIGHTYLLDNYSVNQGQQIDFEWYVDTMPYLKDLMANDPEKFADIKSIRRTSWSYTVDPDRKNDAKCIFGTTVPGVEVDLDITDGIGKTTGTFKVERNDYDQTIPTWCAAMYNYRVVFNDSVKHPPQSFQIAYIVRFEV